MSFGGNDTPQTATTTTANNPTPWASQQAPLQFGYDQAKANYQSDNPSFFPNATYVPFSPQTTQALDMQQNRAVNGSPLNMGAQQDTMNTINGTYLNQGNPGYQNMVKSAIDPLMTEYNNTIMPGIDARFALAGRGGSNIAKATADNQAAKNLEANIGNITSGLSYNTYNAERGRQQTADQMAPTLANTDYQDISQLGQVGALNEQQAGAQLQDQMNRFNFNSNLPDAKLRQYMTLIGGGTFGGTGTSTQPIIGANPWLQGAGLGIAGAGAAGALFGANGAFGNGSSGALNGMFG